MNDMLHLSTYSLIAAAAMVSIAAVVSIILKLKLEKDLFVGVLRSFLQLMVVGYILDWVFVLNRWYLVTSWLLLMVGIAAYNAMRRQGKGLSGLTGRFFVSIFASSAISIVLGVCFIIKPTPFWGPQYLIPIGGMIIGNAMSSAALSVNRLFSEMKNRSGEIEAALSLGSDVHNACLPAVRASVKTGMMHIISTTMVVGLVHIPGMMTGQIVSGVEPSEAVHYQLVIMYILLTTTALSSLMSVLFVRRLYFDKRHHLLLPE
ncbi:iron export ABC transporter permease subunit FetB [bacterium]|nr:iron export ABC transporter permease subunit FetB [bacterium]